MGPRVTQAKMETAMEALAKKRSDGRSLADLGYATAGLDDAWQACGTGVDKSFHDFLGKPLVNLTTFPDMGGMVKKAHSLGLGAGFYINNCAAKSPSPFALLALLRRCCWRWYCCCSAAPVREGGLFPP